MCASSSIINLQLRCFLKSSLVKSNIQLFIIPSDILVATKKKTHYTNHNSSIVSHASTRDSSVRPPRFASKPAVLHEEERNRLIVHAQRRLRDRERSGQRSNIPRSRATVPIPIESEAKERARSPRERAARFVHASWKAMIPCSTCPTRCRKSELQLEALMRPSPRSIELIGRSLGWPGGIPRPTPPYSPSSPS